jgi:ATP-binding cassette, subfamily B (MDR/TAP), member 1
MSSLIPKRIGNFNGEITFENVEFTYPARPESKILNRINLRIPPGLKVALVGESGCGKSTVLQLIERFYDCDDGRVLIGNERIDVKDVDLIEYRS